jgi:Cu-Zn family superoxide dismutase
MRQVITTLCCLPLIGFAANRITVPMHLLNSSHTLIGVVIATDTAKGLKLTPKLHNLPAGLHGFHVHINPSCADKGMAAGGHLDPQKTKQHLGPYRPGHLGDLPRLNVNQGGQALTPMTAPRLTVNDIKGHSLMIHEGGDNYSDTPKPLGGGGARIACGVIG